MKYIQRYSQIPLVLINLQKKPVSWGCLKDQDKADIRDAIVAFQGNNCAYCETGLDKGRHIEHFAKKDKFPQKTYEWDNLFLSCQSGTHCGHFKDSKKSKFSKTYDYHDLIKPDVDDPSDFLFFSINGEVSPKHTLIDKKLKAKAELTINVFNLNENDLKNIRRSVLKSNKEIIEYIYSLDIEQTAQLLEEYKHFYSQQQFSAALLDLLLNVPQIR